MFLAIWPGWLVQLMTGPDDSREAQWAWAICALIVSQAAVVLVLFGHYDMRFKERSGVASPWEDGQIVRDAINLMALATLWSICLTLLAVHPSEKTHILDLIGRAASLGAMIGLFVVATAGTLRWGRALRFLERRDRREAWSVLAVLSAVFALPVAEVLALARANS
jgi:hypothetical protein